MTKTIFTTFLLISTVLLTSCSLSQSLKTTENKSTQNYIFEHELITINLSTPYTSKFDTNKVSLKAKKDNQNILEFSHTKTDQDLDINEVTALEKDNAKLMCEQTDGCRRIISIEQINIGEQKGIKLFYEADAIDTNETLKWHAYLVYYKGNLFKFQPNGIIGEDAIKSISFK